MQAHRGSWLTVPNLISELRFVIAPVLLYFAWTDQPTAFLMFLGLSFCSDGLDGYVARKLGQTSELGAMLDTAGDFVTYVTVPLCGWWLWPDRIRPEAPFLAAMAISYISPIAVGFVKYGRLTNHHTWGGKLSALLLGSAALILVAGGSPWPFRIAVAMVVLADIEEIAIIAILPRWRSSVPSLWHAMKDINRPLERTGLN